MNIDISLVITIGVLCAVIVSLLELASKRWPNKKSDEALQQAIYRNLETQVRCAQEQAALALHDLQVFRETVAEQRDSDRARISRCEVQVESNERNMVKLGNQFKDEVSAVRAEGTKLAMHVNNTQRRGL